MRNTAKILARCAGFAASLAVFLPAAPAIAATGEKEQSRVERAKGVATQPLEDLNLYKDEIPAKLISIQDDPYSLDGIRTCRQINTEIEELNAVLGADVDSSEDAKRKTVDRVMDVGGGMLASLLPFRGIVREVTGANDQKRRFQSAIFSGVTRRSYLKGMGKAKGCKPPAPVVIHSSKTDAKDGGKAKMDDKSSAPKADGSASR